jgi:uncharacterized protein (TIGR03382 family)
MRRKRARLAAATVVAAAALGSAYAGVGGSSPGASVARRVYHAFAGSDAGVGMDAGIDAFVGSDAGIGMDAGVDAGIGSDAGVGMDAGMDAGIGSDAGVGMDAGMDAGSGSGSGSGGTPELGVDKSMIQFGNVAVHGSGSDSLTIYNVNNSTSSLDNIVVSVGGTDPAEFNVATGCTNATPCTIPVFGTAITIPVTFLPTVHGLEDATITVTSNGGSASVSLVGTGYGAVMALGSGAINFGTVGLGQMVPRTVNVENHGNFPQMPFSVGSAAPPYSVSPGSGNVDPGTPVPVTVTCGSNTPSADNNPQTILFDSTDPPTYLGAMQSLAVTCTIANTQLQVLTPPFDFGEVRVGTTPDPAIDVTLQNPASAAAPADVTDVRLAGNPSSLSIGGWSDTMLAPGDSRVVTMTLDASAESDLGSGAHLDVSVDGQSLHVPVTGKVVTPKSRIAPAQLDLGTACVGTQVAGNVMLVNEGTATLTVFAPSTDSAFTAMTPTTIPAAGVQLPSGMSSIATVSPSAAAMGTVSGMLEWKDDVPSDYKVPVTLEYVANGTAVSPAALDFGSVEVGSASDSQMITAQNCEIDPKPFKLEALRGKDGAGPIGAWKISPLVGFSTNLGAHDIQVITVHFDPPGRGHYEADLELETDLGTQTIHLSADATGRDFDRTSVYACSCAGGDVSGGWPIVLALFGVRFGRRRRRGSSSAR